MSKRKPDRLLMAVTVTPSGTTTRYYVAGEIVDALVFAAELRAASQRGRLKHFVTQSTGFGWRAVWEVTDAVS